MTMSVDHDDGVHAGFMWENQSWSDLLNFENIGESGKQKLGMKSLNHKEGLNEGEVHVNKTQSRDGVVIRSENDINGGGKDEIYRDLDHEMHLLAERERRKKMRNMFSSLHALLPELPSKANNSTIVDAAVKQIKNLKQIVEHLEKKKQEKLKYISLFKSDHGSSSYDNNFATNEVATSYHNSKALAQSAPPPQQIALQTWSYQNVVLNICGGEAQFSICATKMKGLFSKITFVLEKYRIDVVSANITCNGNGNFYMILAQARQFLHDSNSVEETYKQAATEIMMLIS
ncbi:unnamed protein product [Lathyrus sativus]|nr:unnamed protein product [Lathyrus sativus]